ncbi:citrate lyase subunit beta / citryl-CoA lyase [Actinopolyspora saharensis]|uniref:Citrate lyase subunit beta / citryl-CoA lyase n=1 Tax=Actinopolyspora saharensis TaxID=995062 RepID=A0A1H0YNL5_9ACTN|nr:citrate lyase subunit beta / citryl-CoA lyase [Actinopolyspora saharensis]
MSSEPHRAVPRVPLRSLLFVPGTKTEWLTKAARAGADAAIIDLEDAVPVADKVDARNSAVAALQHHVADHHQSPALFVRVNALDTWDGADDVRAVTLPGLHGIVLPKVDGPEDVRLADRLLTWCEREQGLPTGSTALVPLLETARSLRDAHEVGVAAQRVAYLGALTADGGDVARAVGYHGTPQGTETLTLRSRVLLDARAAGVEHPVAGLWTRLDDPTGLRVFAEQNRSLGYEGMMAIHPSHVPIINEVFSPSPEELARWERLVATVEQARSRGEGAVAFEGQMVDEAMATTARHLLARHAGSV